MTRVAIDSRVLDDARFAERGIGRYTRCLLDAFAAADRAAVALRAGRATPRGAVAPHVLNRPPLPGRIAELAEHALLGRDARRAGADVLHSPSIDFATTRPGMPYVVTVHDLVPLKQSARYLRTGLKHRLRYAAVERATRVVVPTRAVAADLERLLGIDPSRIDVVPEAPAPVFSRTTDTARLLARFGLPERYLIWVGGLDPPDPRKGVEALARAVARGAGLPLVLVGRVSPEAAALASPGRVLLVGRASDEELAALYTRAEALVLPSEDEGFGLTPAEALACGTPVAAFAIDALREQYEPSPAVSLVEPGDLDALLDAAEDAPRPAAADSPRSWTDVATETWQVYERASAERRAAS